MNHIPAAAYYRMSTDRQEDSIDRQRSQVEHYAKRHGFRITRDYLDEGIAGDEGEKRKAFMQMLRDAQDKKFSVILCDDKDRFGRFDLIDNGFYVKPLRDGGVHLETVAQGRIDWSSFLGRITDAILQEAKKIESQATSRRVITRMLLMAKQGKWLGGIPPYGYRVELVPVLGKKLVPGDPEKVKTVELLFQLYGGGSSLDEIIKILFDRGIPGPKGGQNWNKTTVRVLLKNRKYIGDMCWNIGHDGKYSELAGGAVKTSDSKIPQRNNPAEDWIVIPNFHESLIDRLLFEKVQVRLAQNKLNTSPATKGKPYLLTGLLVCGNCGSRMIGNTFGGKRYFKCGRYHHMGKQGCGSNMVMESKVLRCISRKVQEVFLNPKNQEKLREEIRRQEEMAQKRDLIAPGLLKQQVEDLARKISQGIGRLALIDADLMDDFKVTIRGWKEEKARLETELVRLSQPVKKTNINGVIQAAEAKLRQFQEAIGQGKPALVKEFLRQMINKVEMHFEQVPRQKKTRSIFRRGVIFLRPQTDLDLPEYLWAKQCANLCNAASPIRAG